MKNLCSRKDSTVTWWPPEGAKIKQQRDALCSVRLPPYSSRPLQQVICLFIWAILGKYWRFPRLLSSNSRLLFMVLFERGGLNFSWNLSKALHNFSRSLPLFCFDDLCVRKFQGSPLSEVDIWQCNVIWPAGCEGQWIETTGLGLRWVMIFFFWFIVSSRINVPIYFFLEWNYFNCSS